jgi:hypothetical protein
MVTGSSFEVPAGGAESAGEMRSATGLAVGVLARNN